MYHKLLILIPLLFFQIANAQLKHYISYNTVVYADIFNKEKDKSYFPQSFKEPDISYSIEKNKIGIEINYINRYGTNYYPLWSRELVPNSSILQANSSSFSINLKYSIKLINKIEIKPFIGVVRNYFESYHLLEWGIYHGDFDIRAEKKLGMSTGFNCIFFIYKGIFLNSNLRYFLFPTADYNKQNLIGEAGIGYMFQRKKR